MNCANHPDIAVSQYCRTCGKPLCTACVRNVQGVAYCEQCLAERLQGVPPQPTVYQQIMKQGAGLDVPPTLGPGPNPALAGILAGFFPFGVGAVYTGQYAKGLAHLVILTLMIWGETVATNDGISTILGIGIAFFYVYQIIDAVKSAHAIRAGQPPPDPFGLAAMFGSDPRPAATVSATASSAGTATAAMPQPAPPQRIPTAAVILIGLGCLFLLQTVGVFEFSMHRVWPLFLIALGVWLLARNSGWLGPYYSRRGFGRPPSLIGPVVLITIGGLMQIERMNGPDWGRTWPILLLAIGITKLLERRPAPAAMPPMPPSATDAQSPASNEVNRG